MVGRFLKIDLASWQDIQVAVEALPEKAYPYPHPNPHPHPTPVRKARLEWRCALASGLCLHPEVPNLFIEHTMSIYRTYHVYL